MLYSKHSVTNCIHYIPGSNIVYLNNAKVACSTIKKSLWLWSDKAAGNESYVGDPHDRFRAPFCQTLEAIADSGLDEFLAAKFFTVVRNPYVRVLSAYLDKIASTPRDLAVWQPIARRFRLPGDARPSFHDFIQMLSTENPYLIDQHFAPQSVNILAGIIRPNFIAHLERMEDAAGFLEPLGVGIEKHVPHITRASDLVRDYYGHREIEMVRSYYREDFELFGYGDDPLSVGPESNSCDYIQNNNNAIKLYIQSFSAESREGRKRCIDALKNIVPSINAEYIYLEAGALPLNEIRRLGDRVIRGEISNWRLISKIGQELARNDMIYEAASVFQRAKAIMYPQSTDRVTA